jgi:hypothetical protein
MCKLSEEHVVQAVSEAAASKVLGINGIISGFWRRLRKMDNECKKDKDESTQSKRGNIIKVLTWVYNAIKEHRVIKRTDFVLGWMCPIFRKKD